MELDKYELDIEKIISNITKNKYKKILLQLPDGLKPLADQIQEKIQKETDSKIFIWAGSNFGACDVPLHVEKLNFDLIVHFGHSKWN